MLVEFAKLWAIHFGGTIKAQEYENQTKRVCESGRSGRDSWGVPRNSPKLGGSRKDADAQKPGQRVPAVQTNGPRELPKRNLNARNAKTT